MTSLDDVALIVSCGFCWAAPGKPCGADGQHLARYLRCYRRGLIGRETLAVLCEPLPHVSAGQIIPCTAEVLSGGEAPTLAVAAEPDLNGLPDRGEPGRNYWF